MIGPTPLIPLGTLIVRAKDLADRPLPGLPIRVRYACGTPFLEHATDAAGEVRLRVTPRTYLVGAEESACFEWDRKPHVVEVRPLGITRVVLTLPVETAPSTR
ncbi:MAG: hypothetical protein ACYTEZ_10285 [Planctomycetota bacterium]|jgi:hypothetical protein